MSDNNVDSLLRQISSTRIKNEVDNAYSGVSEAMKQVGAPTSNMLLSAIHSETKRTADELVRLNSRMSSLEATNSQTANSILRLCNLIETQNEILASMAIGQPQELSQSTKGHRSSGQDWYYQGTKLSSRYHVYACILFHLIDMVQVHMDIMDIQYPDSVDCDFKTMQNAVRIVSTERCSIQNVEYKNTISAKEKDSQPFDIIYPLISSLQPGGPTTLVESDISKVYNPVTRNVMQDTEWIRQRLCYLDGILSIKQIDILKSIKSPILKANSDHELNWDSKFIKAKVSHPLARDISDLGSLQKNEYIKLRMKGQSVIDAYESAKVFVTQKK